MVRLSACRRLQFFGVPRRIPIDLFMNWLSFSSRRHARRRRLGDSYSTRQQHQHQRLRNGATPKHTDLQIYDNPSCQTMFPQKSGQLFLGSFRLSQVIL
jgi:hypothetical protein